MDFVKILAAIEAFLLSLVGLVPSVPAQSQNDVPTGAETLDITVMSYNVYVVDSGVRSHEKRGNGVISVLRSVMPDVFGLQEADYDWMRRVTAGMPEYSYVGRGREKEENDGEFSPVFYRTDKYELVDAGTFWFSNTPDKASVAWGTLFKRICSWAVLKDRTTGFEFAVFNSHWDHISFVSRNNSASLLIEKIGEYAPNMPVVICGDFNCKPNSAAYVRLVDAGYADSMYVSEQTQIMGTYHGYTKSDTSDELPIDHIMFDKSFARSNSYRVITDKYDGAYPSDHFAIVSEITLFKSGI